MWISETKLVAIKMKPHKKKKILGPKKSKSRNKMNCLHAKTPQGSKTISRKKYPKFLMDEINI